MIRRGVPGRGSSTSPSRRSCRKRVRHLETVVGETCSRLAMLVVDRPAAHARMIRARRATRGALRDRWAYESSRCRSSSFTVTVAGAGPLMRTPFSEGKTTRPPRIFHLFLLQNTSRLWKNGGYRFPGEAGPAADDGIMQGRNSEASGQFLQPVEAKLVRLDSC